MEDVLGTGTIMKELIKAGETPGENDMEAPRKFFARIDIETRNSETKELLDDDCHKDFLISSDADLFPGPFIVLPLMNIEETSRFIFDQKFCYGKEKPKLECVITLKSRVSHDEFVECHLLDEELFPLKDRLIIANRKRERGNFWFLKGDLDMAKSSYESGEIFIEDIVKELSENQISETEAKVDSFKTDAINCHVRINNNLAACCIKLEKFNEAREKLEKVLKIEPTNIKALLRKATIQSMSNVSREAIETLKKVLSIDPNNVSAKNLLVEVQKKASVEYDQEKEMYKRMFNPGKV